MLGWREVEKKTFQPHLRLFHGCFVLAMEIAAVLCLFGEDACRLPSKQKIREK